MNGQQATDRNADKELWLLLRGLINPAATLAAVGVLTIAAMNWLYDFPPLAAARDAILYEHMTEQAYSNASPKVPGAIRFVAFDDLSCEGDKPSEFECQPQGPVDRERLARVIRSADKADPAAIVVDIIPRVLPSGCDKATNDLISAIRDVSRNRPVILPRISTPSAAW